jgi:hypothetical protein
MASTQRGQQSWSRCLVAGFCWHLQGAWVQRGRRWCARCLCWPTAAVAGLVQGCAGSDDGSGDLAASLLPLVMDLGLGVGDGPVRTVVGFSSPRSGVSLGSANSGCPARTAVVVSLPRCGVSLAFANGVDPARTAVVVSPPHRWISPVFGNGSGGLAAPLWGFPCIAKQCVSSEDGGGARAASAGLSLLWLVFFEGAGSDGGGGYLAASRSASRSQWGW